MLIKEHLERPGVREKLVKWDMTVRIETDFYPISIRFKDGVTITREIIENPTLLITMSFDVIIQIVRGKTSVIRGFIKRSIKMRGILRHPYATLRFYKLINQMIGG